MIKTLLIHHDNVPDGTTTKKIKFDYKNSKETPNVDTYISKEILPKLEDVKLIFIKDNLSSSYLELYGLLVAYHIRLSESLGYTRYIPIVILSDIDACTLNKLVPMANILFTKNIFLEPNTAETIEKYKTKSLFSLNEEDYKTHFLDRVAIVSPENSSNHSIANNWAIDRWARFVGAKSDAITINSKKIENMLYFKYLLALNATSEESSRCPVYPILAGKILYIDDEWDKGWSDILSHYFGKNSKMEFETFEHEFKDVTNLFSLRPKIKHKIKAFTPDIVMLDLRLVSNDHTGTNREDIGKYSGIQISKMIKEINPGIQVIMLTATGNSLILEQLYKHGILGYIKKEHPEDKNLKTKDNITKLAELVTEGFEKKYLKEIWKLQNSILNTLDSFEHTDNDVKEKYEKIRFEISIMYEILDSSLENKLKFSLLTLFKVLELLTDIHYDTNGNQSAHAKIKSILVSIKPREVAADTISTCVKKFVCTRNRLIHSGDLPRDRECHDNIKDPLDTDYILKWFRTIKVCIPKLYKRSNNSGG